MIHDHWARLGQPIAMGPARDEVIRDQRVDIGRVAAIALHPAVDASPKGDPAGFVKVVDAQTLAIPG